MSKKNYIIPIFVPHHGCPFDCVFCNQKKITGIDTPLTGAQIQKQIEDYVESIGEKKDKHIEIAFFGGSFTGININKQREFLQIASKWRRTGYVDDIRLSTRPDYINKEILLNLKENDVSIIELGVQSLKDEVLRKSSRGHSARDVLIASKLIRKMGFKLGLQMMIGLPGDSFEKSLYTAEKIISYCPDFVRIYPTLVVRGTELEKLFLQGHYIPLDIDEAVLICKEIYKLFYKNNIPIIRIGLQPTDNIMEGKDVIAGPFHPAFRQLVEAEVFKEAIVNSIDLHKNKINKLEFMLNPKAISNLVGIKKENLIYFKSRYNVDSIKITKDSGILKNKVRININDEEIINCDIY
ncbi:elongator complex protein 3 [Maledivibacter halophilus]|uniref:Radical SAM core domain-containing protein n=1 Tax=Maledivibacter halophilus TaxID=36842 RepID=A0A1T5MGB4_9FIRM|nr:radical SAM protein [Maledivibacter halophilus]SKC87113.1 hypothetical protein SAMN02194393_04641 [Maledivibacter halophilus]